MPLEETVRDIQKNIQNDQYQSEQAISQGIVLRLLSEQGWPVWDPHTVIPEYKVPGGRVDFALCVIKNKPKIFIEVKQPGKTQGADEQVFQYAFHQGVPFVIVTDGTAWHFYLPTAEGSYEDRRVYTLDLVEREIDESVGRLNRYLSFEEVQNGNALNNAKTDYESVSKERQAKSKIPEAWEKLLEEKDEVLINTISKKVESICGYSPNQEQIIAHLKSLKLEVETQRKPSPQPATKEKREAYSYRNKRPAFKIKVEFPDGVEICESMAAQTMIDTFRKIGFTKVQSVGIKTRGLPLVSRESHTVGSATWDDVGSGFFVCTHSGTNQKIKYLNDINHQLQLGLKIHKV